MQPQILKKKGTTSKQLPTNSVKKNTTNQLFALEIQINFFIKESNYELQHLQSDLLQLMENTFENTTEKTHIIANQFSTVHKIYKLIEAIKIYQNK
jgi:hypothetical protein